MAKEESLLVRIDVHCDQISSSSEQNIFLVFIFGPQKIFTALSVKPNYMIKCHDRIKIQLCSFSHRFRLFGNRLRVDRYFAHLALSHQTLSLLRQRHLSLRRLIPHLIAEKRFFIIVGSLKYILDVLVKLIRFQAFDALDLFVVIFGKVFVKARDESPLEFLIPFRLILSSWCLEGHFMRQVVPLIKVVRGENSSEIHACAQRESFEDVTLF